MRLFRHDCGTAIAIGIQDSNRVNIERQFYSFWNHGATTGELHWLNDEFAYFWTNSIALRKSLVEISLFKLLGLDFGKSKGKKRGLMPEAQAMAQDLMETIHFELFLGSDRDPDTVIKPHSVGYLEWNTPNLDWY